MANKTPIITASELKDVLGSSISNTLAEMYAKIATNILCELLGVNELVTSDDAPNTTTKEPVQVLGTGDVLQFNGFPIDLNSIELYNSLNQRIDTGIVYRKHSSLEKLVNLENSSGVSVNIGYGDCQVLATYVSGYLIDQVPEELKYAACLIAGGAIGSAERANGAVSYKLGQKSVQFRNQGEAAAAQSIIDKYISAYNTDLIVFS